MPSCSIYFEILPEFTLNVVYRYVNSHFLDYMITVHIKAMRQKDGKESLVALHIQGELQINKEIDNVFVILDC